ncbi:MAG: fimbrillin family protein, partial [Bacteroidales bacterium]|nr:fimbrillin family protein [Bacteroidales bacterium]
ASAVAVVALLTGCSTENDLENGKDGLASLELSSVSSSDMLTRAVIDGKGFPTDKGDIGLFLYANEDASKKYGDGYANVQYSYNSTKSKWTASPSIKVGSTSGYLYGYYPYDSEVADIKAIPVVSSLNGDDVMYASQQDPITDQTAANTSIKMNHALARVCITVVNKGYTGNAKLSKIKFSGAEIAPEGTLNALDGSVTATKSEVTLDVTGDAQTITTSGTNYECLLVPSKAVESKQEVTLTLTIDGEDKTLTLSGDNGVVFKPGVKSTVTITLSNTGIALRTVSIEDWNVVEVGEHVVTVKLGDEVNPHDVLTEIYAEGGTAKIEAFSKSGIGLKYTIDGEANVSRSKSGNVYTFTISDIQSNVTVTIGYAETVEGISYEDWELN